MLQDACCCHFGCCTESSSWCHSDEPSKRICDRRPHSQLARIWVTQVWSQVIKVCTVASFWPGTSIPLLSRKADGVLVYLQFRKQGTRRVQGSETELRQGSTERKERGLPLPNKNQAKRNCVSGQTWVPHCPCQMISEGRRHRSR